MGKFKKILSKFTKDTFSNLTINEIVEIITYIDMMQYCKKNINGFIISDEDITLMNEFMNYVFYRHIFDEEILRMISLTVDKQIIHICKNGSKRLNDTNLKMISKYFPKIEALNISWNNNITDQGIKNFTNLKILNAGLCQNITDESLANMTRLEELYIQSNNHITGIHFKKMKKLKVLDISCCKRIKDKYLEKMEIEKLSACWNCSIDNKSIEKIKHVDFLDISGNEKVDDDIFHKLKTFGIVCASYNNKIKKVHNVIKNEN